MIASQKSTIALQEGGILGREAFWVVSSTVVLLTAK